MQKERVKRLDLLEEIFVKSGLFRWGNKNKHKKHQEWKESNLILRGIVEKLS